MTTTLDRPPTPNKLPEPAKEAVRDLLRSGHRPKAIIAAIAETFGLTIRDTTIAHYRRSLGITTRCKSGPVALPRPSALMLAQLRPCELCSDPTPGDRWQGRPWQIEGYVCRACRDELKEETRRKELAAQREARRERRRIKEARQQTHRRPLAVVTAKAAPEPAPLYGRRRPEDAERAARLRTEHMTLVTGRSPFPVLTPKFYPRDLTPKVFSHWLRTLWRRGQGLRLMHEFDNDGLKKARA